MTTQAWRYAQLGSARDELEDLLQEARLALLESVRRYRPDRGAGLATFAHYRMRERLQGWTQEQVGAVRVPVHAQRTVRKARRFASEAAGQEWRVTDAELAVHLGVREPTWRRLAARADRRLPRRLVSPDGELEIDVPDARPGPDAPVLARELHEALAAGLAHLPARDREVVERSVGWAGHEPETLDAIGRDLGVTRQRVQQVRARALRHLRVADPTGVLEAFGSQ